MGKINEFVNYKILEKQTKFLFRSFWKIMLKEMDIGQQ